jgi:hypothetical protein
MNANTAMPHTLTDTLKAKGFLPGAPKHITVQTLRIDAGVARCTRCEACNHRGLSLLTFNRHGQYRAIGRCAECGNEVEL